MQKKSFQRVKFKILNNSLTAVPAAKDLCLWWLVLAVLDIFGVNFQKATYLSLIYGAHDKWLRLPVFFYWIKIANDKKPGKNNNYYDYLKIIILDITSYNKIRHDIFFIIKIYVLLIAAIQSLHYACRSRTNLVTRQSLFFFGSHELTDDVNAIYFIEQYVHIVY